MRVRGIGRASGRIGWLATTFALAVVLVVSAWANYRGVAETADTVTLGQANLIEAGLRSAIQPAMDSAELQLILDAFRTAHQDVGVRYIALVNPDGSASAAAGEPSSSRIVVPRVEPGRGPGPILSAAGDRIRMVFVRPAGRPPFGERGIGRERGVRIFRYTVVEFEPVLARGLLSRAERTFWLTCVGAAIVTLVALLFWRTSQQYEHARVRLEEQRRLTQLGEMAAVLAHEIRNPLASLKGNAQLLVEKLPFGAKEHTRAERVVGEATRLEALTTDLLDFARSGAVALQPNDPLEVLRASIADVAEDGFTLETGGAPAQWTLDANRVRHALVNVLINAREVSPDRRPVVRVGEEDRQLIYEVRDFGPGLPEGSEDRIFDPFFTTRAKGTGLGLAVARRVAELHGGRITARNHPEGGAVFRIELPRAAEPWPKS